MNIKLQNKIQRAVHTELARRLLIKFFKSRGIENFDKAISPLALINMPTEIPEMGEKLEIVPYVSKLNPLTGEVELGWYMFVLGTNDMYLGKTKHESLGELVAIAKNSAVGEHTQLATTPRRIVDFVAKMFQKSEEGTVSYTNQNVQPQFLRRPSMTSPTASYYERRRWGR